MRIYLLILHHFKYSQGDLLGSVECDGGKGCPFIIEKTSNKNFIRSNVCSFYPNTSTSYEKDCSVYLDRFVSSLISLS